MLGESIETEVGNQILTFERTKLADLVNRTGPYVIKFVKSNWAGMYAMPKPLKISETPALTWGTATYVTPLAFPLSSALYGRIGLVARFNPKNWRVFDATEPRARAAYIAWVRAQPAYSDLILTVHSTYANHLLRNKFRTDFRIDCVLFNPDQEAEIHTDRSRHLWMAVTDWTTTNTIDSGMSARLSGARFTVLLDEDFLIEKEGLPVQFAPRLIERITESISIHECFPVAAARSDPTLPSRIVHNFKSDGYLHVYIEP